MEEAGMEDKEEEETKRREHVRKPTGKGKAMNIRRDMNDEKDERPQDWLIGIVIITLNILPIPLENQQEYSK